MGTTPHTLRKYHDANYLDPYEELSKHLTGHAAKLKLFAMLVLGIILHRTVNLSEVALAAPGEVKQASFYRRLQRFFQTFAFPGVQFDRLLPGLPPAREGSLMPVMDRTSWKFGRTHINLLQVGAVLDGVLYPLVWKTLPQTAKRGNSTAAQRVELMEELPRVLTCARVECLAMDREFIGRDWLGWLEERGVAFAVRLKSSALLDGRRAPELAKGHA